MCPDGKKKKKRKKFSLGQKKGINWNKFENLQIQMAATIVRKDKCLTLRLTMGKLVR